MSTPESLSAAQARRIAVGAAGFGRSGASPTSVTPGKRHVRRTLQQLGQLQIDSVNVYARAHYLPLFSRLGAYPADALDGLAGQHSIEYWPHQAGLIPSEDWPLWQWRRDGWRGPREWLAKERTLADWLRGELAERGPLTSAQIDHDRNRSSGTWWGWSDVKTALDRMWSIGEVVCLRRRNFERIYELPEALPAAARAEPPHPSEAKRILLERASRVLGVFTLSDLADYWRLTAAATKPLLAQLEAAGIVRPVRVEGWVDRSGRPLPVWMHAEARIPRRIEAATVLSPFDPLVWFRPRAERLFGFHYRIEIYTPAPKRIYGYYTLPVLLGDQVLGRIDLKSDRKLGELIVQSAWAEPGAPSELADRLPDIVRNAASWQGLERVRTVNRGNLAHALPERFELN